MAISPSPGGGEEISGILEKREEIREKYAFSIVLRVKTGENREEITKSQNGGGEKISDFGQNIYLANCSVKNEGSCSLLSLYQYLL